MNGYIAFFNDRRIEIYADTSYQAQLKAVEIFKPSKSKRHLVSVHLAEKGGEQVEHTADF
jgi:hypothetical protein